MAPIGTPVDSLPDDPPAGAPAKKVLAPPPRPAPAPAIVDELLTNEVEGALPARVQRSRAPLILAAVFAVVVVALGGWGFAVHEERQRAKRRFLAVSARAPASAVVRQAEELPVWLLEDPEVAAAVLDARARVRSEQARVTAGRLLARLDSVTTLEQWRAICDEASAADPTWGEPLARRAEATLALERAAGLERGDVSFSVAREALRELDRATERDPTQIADHLLRRARLCLSAPGDPVERAAAAREAAREARRRVRGASAVGLLADARLKALDGDWAGAAAECDAALALDPERADAYLLRAEAKLRTGAPAEAIDDARRTRSRDRWSIDAVLVELEARGAGPRSLGEGARALASDELARVLAFDPTHPRALAARAHVRLTRDPAGLLTAPSADRRASAQDADLALRLDPAQALAHATRAELAFASRDGALAQAAATRAVELAPHLPDLLLLRGRLRARLGADGALDDFDAVLRLRSYDARAHTNRAALLLATGKVALARHAANEALAVDSTLAEAYLQRGLSFYKSTPRQLQEAVNDLSRAISADAGLADAYFYRACVLYDARMMTEALADLDRAELARESRGSFHLREVYQLRGHCLFRLRRWSDARAVYDEYVRRTPAGGVTRKVAERLTLLSAILAGQVDEATIDPENR